MRSAREIAEERAMTMNNKQRAARFFEGLEGLADDEEDFRDTVDSFEHALDEAEQRGRDAERERLRVAVLGPLDELCDRDESEGFHIGVRMALSVATAALADKPAEPPAAEPRKLADDPTWGYAVCKACGRPLYLRNLAVADGCPCNSPRGVNHGLVPVAVCTCNECDPAQTGGTRVPQAVFARPAEPAKGCE